MLADLFPDGNADPAAPLAEPPESWYRALGFQGPWIAFFQALVVTQLYSAALAAVGVRLPLLLGREVLGAWRAALKVRACAVQRAMMHLHLHSSHSGR